MKPYHRLHLDGHISALESLAWQWDEELAEARADLAECRAKSLPVGTEFTRRRVVRIYLNTRRAREWRSPQLAEYRIAAE
ncbi:hypothetical protein PE067_16030 [Paracoccus sp. DMF-8]|uniref:hypothetical protein n=1 Tax=Paracoccus sp. DMF-8 TaxID=3019445 RepID=UPI0023E3BDD2|nr:hypothetical protein [Paracoccus sp. DMF-8]MDF3607516.1 hypothetical protein [Paracoccus sp. DMF-8]